MDVLVIGGTGLISIAIVEGLLGAGHDVTCYTRGESDRAVPREAAHIRGDRTDHDRFEAAMADRDFDCVVDMWCMERADARSAVRAFGGEIEQYVFCSTVDVYETPFETYPVTEDAPRIQPGEGYAPEKAGCEEIFEDAHAAGAFETTILRPWYTYGEGRGIVGTVDAAPTLARLRAGEPILVHGDGTAMWAGTHRDDVARAFVDAVGNEAAFGEAYHTGHLEVRTWNQYFERAAAALGAPDPDLVHVPTDLLLDLLPERTAGLERVFQYSQYYDPAKANRDLGFEHTVTWERGVRRVADWLKARDGLGEPRDPEYEAALAAWKRGASAARGD